MSQPRFHNLQLSGSVFTDNSTGKRYTLEPVGEFDYTFVEEKA